MPHISDAIWESWGFIILCRTQEDLLPSSRVSRMQPPGGCPTNGEAGRCEPWAQGPNVPLPAPRVDANLSPERSAAPATVQVGKTLPWGSEHRPRFSSKERGVVTVHAPPSEQRVKRGYEELRPCHHFHTKDAAGASEQTQIPTGFKLEASQSLWLVCVPFWSRPPHPVRLHSHLLEHRRWESWLL